MLRLHLPARAQWVGARLPDPVHPPSAWLPAVGTLACWTRGKPLASSRRAKAYATSSIKVMNTLQVHHCLQVHLAYFRSVVARTAKQRPSFGARLPERPNGVRGACRCCRHARRSRQWRSLTQRHPMREKQKLQYQAWGAVLRASWFAQRKHVPLLRFQSRQCFRDGCRCSVRCFQWSEVAH